MSRLFETLIIAGATGLLLGSLAMAVGGSISVIEMTTNFRPHLLVVSVALFAAGAFVHRPAAFAAIAAALLLSPSTLPYLLTDPVSSSVAESEITVLQYNTLYTNEDIDAIAEEILDADADAVALHEMTPDRWTELQQLIGHVYPHQADGLEEPLAGIRKFGTILLSKTPLRPAETAVYPVAPIAAVAELNDREVLLVGLHPSPSRTDADMIATRHELLAVTQSLVENHDGPALIVTDLNITPTSPEYRGFIEGLDWPDARRTLGIAPTFPAGAGNPIGIAIDHVFASPEFVITDFTLGDGGGSDHRSLLATIATS